jgi:DNA polymerase-3 subunit alpha (Gram-positive type)
MEDISGVSHFNIKYNDKKVIQLFEGLESLGLKAGDINGQTIGTFAIPECGTNFTIKMIQEAKPKSFADLIRISGLSHGTDV